MRQPHEPEPGIVGYRVFPRYQHYVITKILDDGETIVCVIVALKPVNIYASYQLVTLALNVSVLVVDTTCNNTARPRHRTNPLSISPHQGQCNKHT